MSTALIKGYHHNWGNEGCHKVLLRCFIIKGKLYANYFNHE